MTAKRWIFTFLTAPVLLAASTAALSQSLTITNTYVETVVTQYLPAFAEAYDEDSVLASSIAGFGEATSSLADGKLRSRAQVDAVAANYRTGVGNELHFSIRNTGESSIAFDAGSLQIHFTATYTNESLTGGGARVDNQLSGILNWNTPASGGGATFSTSVVDAINVPGDSFRHAVMPMSNVSIVTSMMTPERVDLVLLTHQFVLAPNEFANFEFRVSNLTTTFVGARSIFDSWNSTTVTLQTPQGVDFASSVPLTWISPVPENGTTLLMLLGAGALGVQRARSSGRLRS